MAYICIKPNRGPNVDKTKGLDYRIDSSAFQEGTWSPVVIGNSLACWHPLGGQHKSPAFSLLGSGLGDGREGVALGFGHGIRWLLLPM